MTRWLRVLGSLQIAVPLLIAIGTVLAWGTIYEARFGTSAVQRVVYHAWWFQALLGFLAVNLAVAALGRHPWKRHHLPFVLAHVGIILILLGGIIGGRFGIEGQLIIPEGEAERTLQLPTNVLVVHQPNPGLHQVFPTAFESQAWIHDPQVRFPVTIDGRNIQLTVDRYYPDAVTDEEMTDAGANENPAVHLRVSDQRQQETLWCVARDPERFGARWGEAHLLFLELQRREQFDQLTGLIEGSAFSRGVVTIQLPGLSAPREIPVPESMGRAIAIEGTPYQLTFKDYFPDFAITTQGLVSRSDQPNNPAVSFTMTGPEGADAYLLFALHPEFQTIHGLAHTIPAEARYTHAAVAALPPNAIAVARTPSGELLAVLTGAASERRLIDPVVIGTDYTHPWLGYTFAVDAFFPHAEAVQRIRNRSDEVKAEALHLVGREGEQAAEAWVGLRGSAQLVLGKEPVTVEYRPAQRELPVTIKLLDFRKIDYPGTDMAAGFESDVQLTDPQRGLILMRNIRMNHPLRYRGWSFFQSSYVPGAVETTVLSVRKDPGTPLVYAGFVIVIVGMVAMFVFRSPETASVTSATQDRS
ncbi:MAG: cytochrome c biogenesis protein ResB [Candidatus Omnitrophica bacterium]|nr:cytochrome c biogenesis protein ResB [Candidatus Omnitrophota bacterium]